MTESPELITARDRAVRLAGRLDPTVSTADDERDLAEAMIDVRAHLRTKNGQVDWHARSGEAKSFATEVYSAIDAPAEEINKLKGRLRQHFLTILKRRVPVDAVLEDHENTFIPDNFYDDLGVFISEQGRSSANDTEALQLAVAAGRLLELVDIETVRASGVVATASVKAALQAVADAALAVHKRL